MVALFKGKQARTLNMISRDIYFKTIRFTFQYIFQIQFRNCFSFLMEQARHLVFQLEQQQKKRLCDYITPWRKL